MLRKWRTNPEYGLPKSWISGGTLSLPSRDELIRELSTIKIMPWQKGVAHLLMPRAAKAMSK